ncbi:FAD-dependent monooxygenase [Bacillus thuringiensis]|nr:FAD-dependent monooxygenase [Bacillus thuringiensis]MRB60946.1 NAD(P)-binding protein [Bacillus thuringiensis]
MGITLDTNVLIVGAGPAGSVLALDLVRRGVRVRIIDKASGSFPGSRAKGIQPRTQEVFEDLGILEKALQKGSDYPKMGIHVGPLTIPFRMQQQNKVTTDVPYPNVLLLPQYETDQLLHESLHRFGVNIEYETAFVCLEQDKEGVTTTLSTGEKIRSQYVVGADGGASMVRKAVGIQFIGKTNDADRILIVDGTIRGLKRKYWHVWPRKQGKQVAACPLPDSEKFQVMIRLTPDDEVNLDNSSLKELFLKLTGLYLEDITWKSVFRPNVRLAERYRNDRIFLIGDAAHVHTPAGAQGLNTGIQDAYNLGWKLGQVLNGADASLLDTYEKERQPIAAHVLKLSDALYAEIEQKNLSGLKRGDEESQLGISYFDGPLAPNSNAHTKTLKVGDRAPDALCIGPNGEKRLFEIIKGPSFTLLAFGEEAMNVIEMLNWPENGASLCKYVIGKYSDEQHIVDKNEQLKKIYGITQPSIILIRPDGYIGGIITNDWHVNFQNISKVFTK